MARRHTPRAAFAGTTCEVLLELSNLQH
jgi:hypothetical protein